MGTRMRKFAVALVGMGSLALLPAAVDAGDGQGQDVCPDYAGGAAPGLPKTDVGGSVPSVDVEAPEGFLIDAYCVKAGSDVSVGDAVVIKVVDPPVSKITITHPSTKDVSHYSVSYVEDTTDTTTTTTTTEPPTESTEAPTTTVHPTTTVRHYPPPPPSSLPATGGGESAGPMLAFATLAIGLGLVAVVAARRRTTS